MILEEFDKNKVAMINPSDYVKKIENFPEVVLGVYSWRLMDKFVEKFKPKIIGESGSASFLFPVYETKIGGMPIAITLFPVGAAATVELVEELIEFGAKKIFAVGYAGCLVPEVKEYGVVIPTSAIRDEGTSYHYMPVTDEIQLDADMVQAVEKFMKTTGVPFTKGKTWTTDGVYRETKDKVEKRKKQGAIMVEMECSALAAVCRFRGVKFAQILWGADTLAFEEYQPHGLIDETAETKEKMLALALDCAKFLAEEKNQ